MKINSLQEFKQAAFNGMWRGLKSQGWKRSITRTGACTYRENNEPSARTCCAVGWLIPDDSFRELHQARLCSASARQVVRFLADPLRDYANNSVAAVRFLGDAQSLHDDALVRQDMEWSFRNLANHHGLTIPDGDG